jgi:hypothetical protein
VTADVTCGFPEPAVADLRLASAVSRIIP